MGDSGNEETGELRSASRAGELRSASRAIARGCCADTDGAMIAMFCCCKAHMVLNMRSIADSPAPELPGCTYATTAEEATLEPPRHP